MWQEINQRVGYPLKYALIDLESKSLFNRNDAAHLFASSTVGMAVANIMLQRCIGAWKLHSIPGWFAKLPFK
jgi:hypothetical protein